MTWIMQNLQLVGRSLMLPIAVLPAAGLLLRLGQPDLLDIAFMSAAGQAIFDNLGLLFAIGVAVGFAKEGHGAAGLSGVTCYLVSSAGARALLNVPEGVLDGVDVEYANMVAAGFRDQALSRVSVPLGIISGLAAGVLYNRYSAIKLPDYLAFFGGKRFVPIASAGFGMVLAFIVGETLPAINQGMSLLSNAVMEAGSVGLFIYGVLNRILIVTGLHHILNNVAWFVVGDYNGASGDLQRFFAGDPDAGSFMAGFFPVMMFGLPAACLAMYRHAHMENRKEVAGLFVSMALTSFLTGVTEPVEFTFMFVAPVLYALHAILTGVSMAVMDLLNVKLGFGFSAGLFDYLINFTGSTNPFLLLPIGAAYAAIYYVMFAFAIKRFNLETPGRSRDVKTNDYVAAPKSTDDASAEYVKALGGANNIRSISSCATRLRLDVNDGYVDEMKLKSLGAMGVIRPAEGLLQVVVGGKAENLADDILRYLDHAETSAANASTDPGYVRPHNIGRLPKQIAQLFGGHNNIMSAHLSAANRLSILLRKGAPGWKEGLSLSELYPVDLGQGDNDRKVRLLVQDAALLSILRR